MWRSPVNYSASAHSGLSDPSNNNIHVSGKIQQQQLRPIQNSLCTLVLFPPPSIISEPDGCVCVCVGGGGGVGVCSHSLGLNKAFTTCLKIRRKALCSGTRVQSESLRVYARPAAAAAAAASRFSTSNPRKCPSAGRTGCPRPA